MTTMSTVKINLTGKRFGRFLVISLDETKKKTHWNCQCDCGTLASVRGEHLTKGTSKSCGCLKNELAAERARLLKKTHSMTGTKIYYSWGHMIQRCTNPNNQDYSYYGGRGITVCEEWKTFANFYRDMYESYLNHVAEHGENNTTLDKINNNKGYSKENCRWATRHVQRVNQRRMKKEVK